MYGLDGGRRLPESTLDYLSGYENSAPVRIGNAAAGQFQSRMGLTAGAAGLP
jgi:GH15 family glucan-1,4-alpha-glucosidase